MTSTGDFCRVEFWKVHYPGDDKCTGPMRPHVDDGGDGWLRCENCERKVMAYGGLGRIVNEEPEWKQTRFVVTG